MVLAPALEILSQPIGPVGPVGFAAIDALGQNGTIGGGNANPIEVASFGALHDAVSGSSPKVIHVIGDMADSGTLKPESDVTILGLGSDAKFTGFTLAMGDAPPSIKNVIVRNITLDQQESGRDALNCESNVGPQGSHHIWIDHCTFIGPVGDGAVDITQGSTLATVSWCHFKQCDKTMLSGRHGFEELGTGRWTIHHNWFEGCRQRQPFTQEFGWAHCFNNYYDVDPGFFSRAIDLGQMAQGYVDGNYFKNCLSSVRLRDSTNCVIDGGGNVFDNSASFSDQNAADCFVPTDLYPYILDPGSMINALVPAGAGAGNM